MYLLFQVLQLLLERVVQHQIQGVKVLLVVLHLLDRIVQLLVAKEVFNQEQEVHFILVTEE